MKTALIIFLILSSTAPLPVKSQDNATVELSQEQDFELDAEASDLQHAEEPYESDIIRGTASEEDDLDQEPFNENNI